MPWPAVPMTRSLILPLLLAATLTTSACDLVNERLGLEAPGKKEARMDGEGRAVGSACRQSGRAIEDCYTIYHWLPRASIFAGWRDMNDYMIANQMKEVAPTLEPPPAPGAPRAPQAAPAPAAPVPNAPAAVPPATAPADTKH